jgi:hypothetical protein
MYLDRYKTPSDGNTCSPRFAWDHEDRWAVTHVCLPLFLVYVHLMHPRDAMLLVYVAETIEITFTACVLNVDLMENTIDTILLDPLYGAIGIAVGVACSRYLPPADPARCSHWGGFVATLAPTVVLWVLHDDAVAQAAFGVLAAGVVAVVDWRLNRRLSVEVAGFVAVLGVATAAVPLNQLYTTILVVALVAVAGCIRRPSQATLESRVIGWE